MPYNAGVLFTIIFVWVFYLLMCAITKGSSERARYKRRAFWRAFWYSR